MKLNHEPPLILMHLKVQYEVTLPATADTINRTIYIISPRHTYNPHHVQPQWPIPY